jgi:hypothetical protein
VNVPGLFFAGTLSHGKDHLRAAGGFIHGFRYTARALHRLLENRLYNVPWPGPTFAAVNAAAWDGNAPLPSVAAAASANGTSTSASTTDSGSVGGGEGGEAVDGSCTRREGSAECDPLPDTATDTATGTGATHHQRSDGSSLVSPEGSLASPKGSLAPSTRPLASASASFEALLDRLLLRINTASGPYQMVSVLADGVVFRCPADSDGDTVRPTSTSAQYLEEVPIEHFNRRHSGLPRLAVHFGYGQQSMSFHAVGGLLRTHLL